ncbi:YfgM family protein [Planctobacterium marinum]|uniref:Ancillary SecYEG translocon subunit n=1 Tax=Planctobacterium marinum TaxID=1631968 RepID=A0AA48HJ49_9ALTE|nr:membrane protein [Planctobacterium marinum]
MDHLNTEEEQIEAIKKFWKENGMPIIVGAALGLGGLWGWRFYNEQQLKAQEQASDAYNVAVESSAADETDTAALNAFIDANSESTYAVMAALQLAKVAVEQSDLAEAEKQLQWAADTVKDAAIKDLALVRLARVQNELEKFDVAKSTLDKVSSDAFQAQAFTVKGDILARQELFTEAQESYTKALELTEGNPALIQMKIDHLNAKVSS